MQDAMSERERFSFRLLALALIAFVSGCAAPGVATEQEKAQIGAANYILVLSKINDNVFGTRAEGIWQKMTPVYETSWKSNNTISSAAAKLITLGGRRSYILEPNEITFDGERETASAEDALSEVSRAISKKHPDANVDIHLLVMPLPLDRYGKPKRYGQYFMTWGFLGLLSHSQEEFRPAYVVRVNDVIAAIDKGKVECLLGYSLVAIDAHSHEILADVENRIAHGSLSDDFWLGDYVSLPDEQKQILKNACLQGIVNAIAKDLQGLGLSGPVS